MLIDGYGRKINYLRLSVTDRCNLRCRYCMPAAGLRHKPQSEILSFEQIYRIVNCAVGLGIDKVRITGGEPLIRKDLSLLINWLRDIPGLNELCLTTNGTYLVDYASSLKRSGLDRVNISLDSLIPEKFQRITRGGKLEAVLKGIEVALSAGFSPLKINMVLIKGFNTDEILDFTKLTKTRPIQVRFIEYMPTGLNHSSQEDVFFSAQEAKDICSSLGELKPVANPNSTTARSFRIAGFYGTVSFISPISQPFCSSCNKLRLTSDGHLKNCLYSAQTVDLKTALSLSLTDENLVKAIKEAVALKPRSSHLSCPLVPFEVEANDFSMCQIGG